MMNVKEKHIALCEGYCPWYKPGEKEEMACHGIVVVDKMKLGDRLPEAPPVNFEDISSEINALIESRVCSKCNWRVTDCDYSNPEISNARPCGGVAFLAILLASDEISEDDL